MKKLILSLFFLISFFSHIMEVKAWFQIFESSRIQVGSIRIDKVFPGTPAAKVGLREDDVILKIANKEPLNVFEAVDFLQKEKGKTTEIVVERDKIVQSFLVPLPTESRENGVLGVVLKPTSYTKEGSPTQLQLDLSLSKNGKITPFSLVLLHSISATVYLCMTVGLYFYSKRVKKITLFILVMNVALSSILLLFGRYGVGTLYTFVVSLVGLILILQIKDSETQKTKV